MEWVILGIGIWLTWKSWGRLLRQRGDLKRQRRSLLTEYERERLAAHRKPPKRPALTRLQRERINAAKAEREGWAKWV